MAQGWGVGGLTYPHHPPDRDDTSNRLYARPKTRRIVFRQKIDDLTISFESPKNPME
jgi:hypothetical protein